MHPARRGRYDIGMLLGSHLSIGGGLHNALLAAGRYGFSTVAMFLRAPTQWVRPRRTDEAIATFRRTRRRLGISPVVAHGSYLVNLAGRYALRRKSITATRDDLATCGRLGIEYLVLHPGSRADTDEGIRLIADALNEIFDRLPYRRPKVLLETTAGAGQGLGGRFEHLAGILALIRRPRRVGVCLDTCHVFAAGYDLRTPATCRRTLDEFDRTIGLDRLAAIHLNDSLGPLGRRRDRHTHIGHGHIGRRGFGCLVRDPRLATVPMILETPKGLDDRGRDWDEVNARTLRALARRDGADP